MTTELVIVNCPYCAALSYGAPPHGEGQPCPLKVRVDEAYIEKLDAERMALIRHAPAMQDMGEAMRKMAGLDESD